MRDGRFREDLYYRVNAFAIRLPSLRERQVDIPVLAQRFLARYCAAQGLPLDSKAFSREALDLLVQLPLAGQHPRARKHGVARGAVGAGPIDPRVATSSSCTRLRAGADAVAATGCRRSPKPSARTSCACSKRCSGTRRKPRGCSTSAAARCTGRSSSISSNPKPRPARPRARAVKDAGPISRYHRPSSRRPRAGCHHERSSDRGAALRRSRAAPRARSSLALLRAAHRSPTRCSSSSLLVCSSLASALKVNLPLAHAAARRCRCRTRSISRRCCCSAPTRRCSSPRRARGASARSGRRSRSAPYRTLFSMASLVLTVKAAGSGLHVARRPAAGEPFTLLTIAKPLVGAATTYFVCNTLLDRDRHRPVDASSRSCRVWNENFLWSAPSYFVGAGAAAVAARGHRARRLLDGAARRRRRST